MRGARLALSLCCAWLLACAAPPPKGLGSSKGQLADCPSSPNCVSTQASEESHRTKPFLLALPADEAWARVPEAIEAMEGGRIAEQTDVYLHAEFTSPLMNYVDDLELLLLPERSRIAVRSASRTGWWDMGANRERVWQLRRQLSERGVLPGAR